MPLYEYQCDTGHATERIVSYERRDEPYTCRCGLATHRLFPLVHAMPDGMYSYAPNVGSEEAFSRRLDAMRSGVKVMPKFEPKRDDE
jgi:hypothetical protein